MQQLDLSHCYSIPPNRICEIVKLAAPSLTYLSLSGNDQLSALDVARMLSYTTRLIGLKIRSWATPSPTDLTQLLREHCPPSLTQLDLSSYRRLEEEDIPILVHAAPSTLTTLWLEDTNLRSIKYWQGTPPPATNFASLLSRHRHKLSNPLFIRDLTQNPDLFFDIIDDIPRLDESLQNAVLRQLSADQASTAFTYTGRTFTPSALTLQTTEGLLGHTPTSAAAFQGALTLWERHAQHAIKSNRWDLIVQCRQYLLHLGSNLHFIKDPDQLANIARRLIDYGMLPMFDRGKARIVPDLHKGNITELTNISLSHGDYHDVEEAMTIHAHRRCFFMYILLLAVYNDGYEYQLDDTLLQSANKIGDQPHPGAFHKAHSCIIPSLRRRLINPTETWERGKYKECFEMLPFWAIQSVYCTQFLRTGICGNIFTVKGVFQCRKKTNLPLSAGALNVSRQLSSD